MALQTERVSGSMRAVRPAPRRTLLAEKCIPSGWQSVSIEGTTAGRLCIGSPMPMYTRLLRSGKGKERGGHRGLVGGCPGSKPPPASGLAACRRLCVGCATPSRGAGVGGGAACHR